MCYGGAVDISMRLAARHHISTTARKAGLSPAHYWIVNPLDDTITALALDGETYAAHSVFRRGERASSKLLDGFSVRVDEVFDAP